MGRRRALPEKTPVCPSKAVFFFVSDTDGAVELIAVALQQEGTAPKPRYWRRVDGSSAAFVPCDEEEAISAVGGGGSRERREPPAYAEHLVPQITDINTGRPGQLIRIESSAQIEPLPAGRESPESLPVLRPTTVRAEEARGLLFPVSYDFARSRSMTGFLPWRGTENRVAAFPETLRYSMEGASSSVDNLDRLDYCIPDAWARGISPLDPLLAHTMSTPNPGSTGHPATQHGLVHGPLHRLENHSNMQRRYKRKPSIPSRVTRQSTNDAREQTRRKRLAQGTRAFQRAQESQPNQVQQNPTFEEIGLKNEV
uniref:Uncharacterized protein n=1 Tax=Tetraselmis sp. GSL018 TaxID=582737 RepID=A0A061S667_9CHLO|mmetsp:Transcript_33476/g.79408  ORF Transcript_33476/g.79408 Transcript_33476/m.79408 type:complete len:312 (+) Transcript_33476:575-1510(+)